MRFIRSVIVFPFFIATAAIAQPPPPGPRPTERQMPPREQRAEQPRGTGILRGVVVSADNGSPIRRAQVFVNGPGAGGRMATTDTQGRFEIRNLAVGRFTVSASKGGYVSLQYGQRRPSEPGTPIDLADKQVFDKIVIGLPRGSVITGRISDEFGEPMANATVTALQYRYVGGVQRLMPTGSGNARDTTDDQGQFRLFGLPPGEYVVSAAFRAGVGEATDLAGDVTGYAPTYYPGTPNVAEAQRVTVGIGQEQAGVIFSLIATRLVRVSGTVMSSQGAPVSGAIVGLAPANARLAGGAMPRQDTRADASGQFRISSVAPGRYIAQARTNGPLRGGPGGTKTDVGIEFGRQEIMVGADDLDGVVIFTRPGARVIGQIVTDTNVAPSIRPQQVQVSARLAEPDQTSPDIGTNMRVNQNWTFELSGLFDARLFRVGLPDGWILKEVLLNGQDITDVAADLPPGETITGLQIVISERITQIAGSVTDTRGAAITDATIVIFPADDSRWTYQSRFVRTARPDQAGRFQIRGLPAHDRYLAVAVQGMQEGQAGDPEFLGRLRDQAMPFSLTEGEIRALDLRFR